ncbi:hypothetical protein [Aeromonas veronii]|jgi:hypothetical protein
MKKTFSIISFILAISGCSSPLKQTEHDALVIKSGDISALEKLYRKSLSSDNGYSSAEINEISLSLANSYLKNGDLDNSSFVLNTIDEKSLAKDVLTAKVYLAMNDPVKLDTFIKKIECDEFDDVCSELYRVKMFSAIKNKNINQAFIYSEKQRLYGGVTAVSRNDLAALHILSSNYDRAKSILISILQQDPKNKTAKSNLRVLEYMKNASNNK